mgnify:FL=1
MKHIGIITELNPFHNGHAYIIDAARTHFPDKKVILMMSGDYVQRGEPAIFNKYIRTECALSAGADLIFEIPALFATASAEHFASASLLSLAATHLVDTLCFGVETDTLSLLQEIAHFLVTEPVTYQQQLRELLSCGLSYAKARSIALSDHFTDPQFADIMRQPNNILAIEYLKAIERYQLPITPFAIPRTGAGYHDTTLNHDICSASALRHTIKQHSFSSYEDLQAYMPDSSYRILVDHPDARPLFWNDFLPFLQYAFLYPVQNFNKFCDISNDFSNQLSTYHLLPDDFDSWLNELSKKHMSETRIKRCLLNILLMQTQTQMHYAKSNHYVSYLRLLGFRKESSFLLKEMQQTSSLPIIQKVTRAKNILSEESYRTFCNDIRKSHLYNQAFYNHYGITLPTEYERNVIIYTSSHIIE